MMMSFEELVSFLKRKFKNDKSVRIVRYWELIGFKYLNYLTVDTGLLYTLKEKKGIWTIKQIDERGNLKVDKEFNDEFEACKFFLELMRPLLKEMTFEELVFILKSKFKEYESVKIIRMWDLIGFKYLNQLTVEGDPLYTIKEKKGVWKVTLEERGIPLIDKEFNDESEACKFFFKFMQDLYDEYEEYFKPAVRTLPFGGLVPFLRHKFKNNGSVKIIRPWEFLLLLKRLKVKADSTYTIKREKGIWMVKKVDKKEGLLVNEKFNDEFKACRFFLELVEHLLKD